MLLRDGPVARMYSDQVHSHASLIASFGKYPMRTRLSGSGSYVTERRSWRSRTSTRRMMAIRLLLSNMNHTPASGVACSCDIGDQCCTTRVTLHAGSDRTGAPNLPSGGTTTRLGAMAQLQIPRGTRVEPARLSLLVEKAAKTRFDHLALSSGMSAAGFFEAVVAHLDSELNDRGVPSWLPQPEHLDVEAPSDSD